MSKRPPTRTESKHLERVAELPCMLCSRMDTEQIGPTSVHHMRMGQGGAQRAGHFLTIALCYECHQGDLGIHGDRTLLRIARCEELDLLEDTLRALESRWAA